MKLTTKSQVLQWGQLTFTGETLDEFEAGTTKDADLMGYLNDMGRSFFNDALGMSTDDAVRKNQFAVDSRDVQLHYLYNKVITNPSTENQQALADEIDHRMKVD